MPQKENKEQSPKTKEKNMTEEKKKVAIQYQMFRWGPCLVKLSISKENQ